MITVKLAGGLGNQMFQYALGRSLSLRYGVALALDLSFLLDRSNGNSYVYRDYYLNMFDISVDKFIEKSPIHHVIRNKFAEKFRFNFPGVRVESQFNFNSTALNCGENCYYSGYWQSPKYFLESEECLRSDFTFLSTIKTSSQALLDRIKDSNSVCLNVRRGDYVGNKLHGVCTVKYYHYALEQLFQRTNNPTVFVFSDDVEWCRANLRIPYEHMFVGHEHAHTTEFKNFDAYFYIMSKCRHYIIPNSTFAWWAVWLNGRKDNVVIVPNRWFNDPNINAEELYEQTWIRV